MKRRKANIGNMSDYFDEMNLLPDFEKDYNIRPKNQLEEFFFDAADKHGIFDFDETDGRDEY